MRAKHILVLLFSVSTLQMLFAQGSYEGLYRGGNDNDSFLSIKQKKNKVEAQLFEKQKTPLTIRGKIIKDSLAGNIWIDSKTSLKLVAWQKDTTQLYLAVNIPNEKEPFTTSFQKINKDPKANHDLLFGKTDKYPDELIGTWLGYDLEKGENHIYVINRDGSFLMKGTAQIEEANTILSPSWYVSNGNQFNIVISKNIMSTISRTMAEHPVPFSFSGMPVCFYKIEGKILTLTYQDAKVSVETYVKQE